MDDRQLLELAAKVAGYTGQWDARWYWMCDGKNHWDPLRHNGQALMLAVELKLKITIGNSIVMVECSPCWIPDVGQEFDSDPHAATRRAIVRMAAEIGRGLVQEKKNADPS